MATISREAKTLDQARNTLDSLSKSGFSYEERKAVLSLAQLLNDLRESRPMPAPVKRNGGFDVKKSTKKTKSKKGC